MRFAVPSGPRSASFLLLAALLAPAGCTGERPPPPPTGEIAYQRHCASCHGKDAKGRGPVAAALEEAPPDLTTLARRNDGVFDESAVMAMIDGKRHVAAHGPREMPVWGAVLQREHEAREDPWPAYVTLLEVRSLVDYLRSIQAPTEAREGASAAASDAESAGPPDAR